VTQKPLKASARAHSNIALIKYWGKREIALNLPAVGSLSVALADLYTDTQVEFSESLDEDDVILDGHENAKSSRRISQFIDLVRAQARTDLRAKVRSRNNFPTGAGLASSASGFAALALAATKAAGVDLSPRELSILARQGSGSAARSLFGGFVEMHRGEKADGSDAYAEPVLDADEWPLSLVIAITETEPKKVDSTEGMQSSAASSAFYQSWVDSSPDDLAAMRAAIAQRDFQAVGELTEYSCLKMHGLMLSAKPGLLYWNPATVALIHRVRELRKEGLSVYFTIDAGPQVKALCLPQDKQAVSNALAEVTGVQSVRSSELGPAAHLIADDE